MEYHFAEKRAEMWMDDKGTEELVQLQAKRIPFNDIIKKQLFVQYILKTSQNTSCGVRSELRNPLPVAFSFFGFSLLCQLSVREGGISEMCNISDGPFLQPQLQ